MSNIKSTTTEFPGAVETEKFYDYIITGTGCAGLSLAVHIIQSGGFTDKKILLVDKTSKTENDRTWCFWEERENLFQSCVLKQWDQLFFYEKDFSRKLSIAPYKYKLIRGIDFYNYCINLIQQQSSFTMVQGNVASAQSSGNETVVTIDDHKVHCAYIFNSIMFDKPELNANQYWLLQHFKGWLIKTEEPLFDPAVATLMDFRTDQAEGTTFFYALPFSETKTFVEYTLFSHNLLKDEQYEAALEQYIAEHLKVKEYSVTEKEFGVIPMTNYRFSPGENNLINIGSAGGKTKGSSGYTFQNIQKHSAAIVSALMSGSHPLQTKKPNTKFDFYDSVLLNILHNKTMNGGTIFHDLFKKNKPQQVLKFLDNETSLKEDVTIMSSLPTIPFAKAALDHLF